MLIISMLWLQLVAAFMACASADDSASNGTSVTELVSDFVDSLSLAPDVASQVASTLEDDPSVAAALSNETVSRRSFGTVQAACDISRLIFGGDSITAADKIQADISKSWTQTCWLNSACVIRPTSTQEVSCAIKIVTFLRVQFAIRSGGHSPNPGWAGIDSSGILIDLGSLNKTSISADHKTVSLGPGAKWGDAVAFLDPYGLTVLAGRVPSVGVGGLILGGGISHFSSQYGLVADTLQSAEVVLADGSVVTASASKNSDLFWALKGGGPNFGIVTRFDLATVPVHSIWYQSNLYAPSQAPAILDAFAQWQANNDPKASTIISFQIDICIVGMVYSSPVASPAVFAPFYAITPLATAVPSTIGTPASLNAIIGASQPDTPIRHDYRAASSKVDATLYKQVYAFWAAKAAQVRSTTGGNSTFVVQHIPKNMVDVGNKNGGNPLGLGDYTQQWWTSIMDWTKASDDDTVRGVGIQTTNQWASLGKTRGTSLPFVYMNDASRDQNPLASYPAANIAKLKSIAKKYDPLGVFQTLQNDGFLLSKL